MAGCGGGDRPAPAPDAPRFDPAFLMNNDIWREQRQAELLQPDGWTSLVGLHWLELKAHYIGSGSTSGIRLAMGPPRLGMVTHAAGRYWFTPERGVAVQVDGKPVKGRASKMHYELQNDFVVLTGNAHLEQLDSNIQGDKITYLVKEQKMQAFSNKGGRVTTVLVPSQLQDKSGDQQKKGK